MTEHITPNNDLEKVLSLGQYIVDLFFWTEINCEICVDGSNYNYLVQILHILVLKAIQKIKAFST